MNVYGIPLTLYRNRGWPQTFILQGADGSPIDLSADELRLIVLPVGTSPAACGAVPLLVNDSPTVSVNVVSFATPDSVTGTLPCGEASWQLLRRSPSGAASSVVVCAGPLQISDSPPFPT
jgi:hypothetical protein